VNDKSRGMKMISQHPGRFANLRYIADSISLSLKMTYAICCG